MEWSRAFVTIATSLHWQVNIKLWKINFMTGRPDQHIPSLAIVPTATARRPFLLAGDTYTTYC